MCIRDRHSAIFQSLNGEYKREVERILPVSYTHLVEQISEVVQSNSAASEECSATSEELSAQAEAMNEMIAQFVLRDK